MNFSCELPSLNLCFGGGAGLIHMEFAGVPTVTQPAWRAMDKVGGPAASNFGRAVKDRMWQTRMGVGVDEKPAKHTLLYRTPTMDQKKLVAAGFRTAASGDDAATPAVPEPPTMLSRLRSLGKSLKGIFVSDYDLSTAFGRISDAVASCVRAPDDVELARKMCQLVGDTLSTNPIDVRVAVRLKDGVYVAIVDAVAAAYCDHATDSEMQRLGTYAIWRLALANKEHAAYLTSLDVVDVIKAGREIVTGPGERYDDRALQALADGAPS